MMNDLRIRPITHADRPWVKQALTTLWGSAQIVYSGNVFDANTLPGLLAEEDGRVVGLLTYVILGNDMTPESDSGQASSDSIGARMTGKVCQIISINALTPGKGIGTALLEEVQKTAHEAGCSQLTVITTNDNLKALGFYQKRGFVLKVLYPNALEKSRKVKPEIPLIGEDGIPLRDEIELEKNL